MSLWLRLVVALAAQGLACGSDGPPPPEDAGTRDEAPSGDAAPPGCADRDGDGAGSGADCSGPDCDDTDPRTIEECGTGCEERPDRRGCPCDPGAGPPICYHGRPEEAGVGICRPGVQTCVDGVRGTCEDQVFPRAEQCDEQDDDCDGEVDDGVGGECGGCGDCASACFGSPEGCSAWSAGSLDHAMPLASRVTLTAPQSDAEPVVWPSDRGNPEAFKVDAVSHEIVGAYYTTHDHVDANLQKTIVNREGDLLAVHWGSWVTRIAAHEADCPDRNGNGVVDTSHAWDDVRSFDGEDNWDDECILWETLLPDGAASITLHETYGLTALVETAWVAIDDPTAVDSGFWELDARTGAPTGRVVSTPNFGPSHSASDDRGRIWATAGGSTLAELDPDHPELGLTLHELGAPYLTITVDEAGFPWVSYVGPEVSGVGPARYDPATEELEQVYEEWEVEAELVPTAAGQMAPDGRGGVWHVSGFPDPFHIDIVTLDWNRLPTGGDGNLRNVGVDLLGQLWVLGRDSGPPGGWVVDLEADEAAPVAVLDECLGNCLSSAAYGDFTGLPWVLLQPQRGVWTDDLVACDQGEQVQWTKVRATARIPRGSQITIAVRTGTDDRTLWEDAWINVGELADGDSELSMQPSLGPDTHGDRFFAVQARLEADRDVETPSLERLEVLWGCQRPAD